MKAEPDEYVFRYKISELNSESNKENTSSISRETLLRTHLKNILNVLVPCNGDSEVKIDGFKLLNNRSEIYRLFEEEEDISAVANDSPPDYDAKKLAPKFEKEILPKKRELNSGFQSLKNASFYEPVIEYMAKQLDSMLKLVELESNGKKADIDAFRLKDLSHWVEGAPCDPADILSYLATKCNCSCIFCYNKGCPSELALVSPLKSPEEEYKEAQTRLKYYYPAQNRNLFPSLGTCFETSIHPNFKDLLTRVREKSGRIIRMATNGDSLTKDMVNYLSKKGPLHLDIALHSSSPERRKRLMRGKNPENGINSLFLLKNAGIVYDVVIVPWPENSVDEMLDDLEQTVAYADKNDCRLVQISLPGYAKHFSREDLLDDFCWETITARVRDIRTRYTVPAILRPAIYEEGLYCKQKNLPEIIGVVKGSPSFYSGLKSNDVITRISGNIIKTRPQARNLLSIIQKSEIETVPIEVLRDNIKLDLILDMKKKLYPYSKEIDTHLGLIFMGTGLKKGYLEGIFDIIEGKKGNNILFLSSFLMKPLLEQLLKESPYLKSNNIKIGVPQNRFFGGNIRMGDLLVVQDYIDYIKDYKRSSGINPDLVIIPSSPFNLSGWGRDLTGRVYLDIERVTGVPVELLECETIYD